MAKSPDRSKKRSATAARSGRGHPPSLQVGALCWRRSGKGLRILLITSRDTGRWVIPKGWPMRRRSDPETAAREAWEEAGVRGEIGSRSLGLFSYRKYLGPGRWIPCVVRVFPLEVRALLKEYPEHDQRKVRWFPPRKAAKRVAEPELRAMIRDFDPDTATEA
ncbi:MAG TPA: NUDIX hydrolase [Amaricoccus sp.]|mgnify:FL=1|uniref:NUDIX hydrolase n=1 Tax=Amaricoccus sp. TaxID=1872485 RepID=UPI002BFFCC69|nr:NUDIX hydrolase [Amaricoccus sp.]HMQ95002.1 NUDIX hydrolase [Amaricoccus sp.]HMR54843.1 NUDIX hydrolase [Amaricoccus sp.]HMR61989.1 NUDIX hydrolase [Amaricoccus sp.]HMU01847.1 NUDIX hydrolase [Amaricoccus sp.]